MKTKEILINSCYGGFSFSAVATAKIAERKGKTAYFFKWSLTKTEELIPLKLTDIGPHDFFTAYAIPDPTAFKKWLNELVGITKDKDWSKLSQKKKDTYNRISDMTDIYYRDLSRDDPDALAVVKKLGERANGHCACLKIVKIPANVDWVIHDYDGCESVEEVHRSWS